MLSHMLELLLAGKQAEVDARAAALQAQPRGDRRLVERVEHEVSRNPEAGITFGPAGRATVHGDGRAFDGGVFETPSMAELRARQGGTGARSRLSVLIGSDPLTDIGLLQATAAPGTTFQVASQFNCLEATDPYITRVYDYFRDPTQGPRAAISAFPGTLVRHYAAPRPGGGRFVQTEDHHLNLLERALPAEVATVHCGYLTSDGIPDFGRAAATLEENFEQLCVGVHRDVEVCFGGGWDGAVEPGVHISQVTTSTFAGGGYSGATRIMGSVHDLCRSLLRAAYLGTFLAAQKTVVLTLIGGGVFANPHSLIFNSLLWALDQRDAGAVEPLDVVLNARLLDDTITFDWVRDEAKARGGAVVHVADGRLHKLV
jgi:hypothetical protein